MLREKGKQERSRLKSKGGLQTSWSHLAFKEIITFLCLSACSPRLNHKAPAKPQVVSSYFYFTILISAYLQGF